MIRSLACISNIIIIRNFLIATHKTINGFNPLPIADVLQQKYSVNFFQFSLAKQQRSQTINKIKTLRENFKDDTALYSFEDFLEKSLSEAENQYYHNPQKKLSEAFVQDINRISDKRPIILFFDTYEVVQNFADDWIRNGLLQYCLSRTKTQRRFIFVIAGRLTRKIETTYRDDIKRVAGEGSLYLRDLKEFTPGDIQLLLQKEIGTDISYSDAEIIHKYTEGIPLAVKIAISIFKSTPTTEPITLLKDIEGDIIAGLTKRFLRHCIRQPEQERNKELIQIYSLALFREGMSGELVRRIDLLKKIWLKLDLIGNNNEFEKSLQNLSLKYSFLLSAGRMHPEVRTVLRNFLQKESEEYEIRIKICRIAKNICQLELKLHFSRLKKLYNREEPERAKYRNILWQQWLLDFLNFCLWLQEYDEVTKILIEAYIMAIQYGSDNFHIKLIELVEDVVFWDTMPDSYKNLIRRLKNLKEWLATNAMEAEKKELLSLLGDEAELALRMMVAKGLLLQKKFENCYQELIAIEQLYLKTKKDVSEFEIQLASLFHSLGGKWTKSSKRRIIQIKSLEALRKAIHWDPNNSQLRLKLAEILINLQRIEEAKFECIYIRRITPDFRVIESIEDKIRRISKSNNYLGVKQAHILTVEGNAFSARGEFEEAKRMYKSAISANQSYIIAFIKLIHLLTKLGCLDEAIELFDKLTMLKSTKDVYEDRICNAQGAMNLALGNLSIAESAYRKAIELSPEYINPRVGLGKIYIRQGLVDKAIDTLSNAWNIKKRSHEPIQAYLFWIHNDLGLAHQIGGYTEGAKEHFMIAEKLCQECLLTGSESRQYHTWSQLAISQLGQNKYEDTLNSLQRFKPYSEAKGLISELIWEINLLRSNNKYKETYDKIYLYTLSLL